MSFGRRSMPNRSSPEAMAPEETMTTSAPASLSRATWRASFPIQIRSMELSEEVMVEDPILMTIR